MPNQSPPLTGLQLAANILALCQETGASARTQYEALSIASLVLSNALVAAQPTAIHSAVAGAD